MNLETPNYPIHAFPEILSLSILEQFNNNEAALPTIGCSLISALSGAIQDKVDVEWMPGSIVPSTVNTLSIDISGSRKTTADRKIKKVFADFEKIALLLMRPMLAANRARQLIWKAQYDRLEKQMKDDSLDEDLLEEFQVELENHLLAKPTALHPPKIAYRDATPEALAKCLSAWPSGLLTTSEAGAIFGGRTMSNLGFFSSLWDGEELRIDRASGESYVVEAPRLSLALMAQELTFAKFLSGQGHLARDNGFLARFLVCQPTPLAGTRFGMYATGSWEHHERVQARLMDILKSGIPVDGARTERKILLLSVDARIQMKIFSDKVETELAFGRYLSDVRDCASKISENAVRLAGLFHFFSNTDGSISAETIKRSIDICTWHMLEFKRLFGEKPAIPLEVEDAVLVEKCLATFSINRPGTNCLPKKYLFTHGPNAVRKKARLDLALQVLWSQGKINVEKVNGTFMVFLNPYFFAGVNQSNYTAPPQSYQPVPPRWRLGDPP
jgi:hypothetical protein